MTGIVHHYDPLRRFGKITGEDRREYFVHQSQTFMPIEAPRGPRALAVRPLELGG